MIKMIPSPKKYEISEEKCFVPVCIFTKEDSWKRGCEIFAQMYEWIHENDGGHLNDARPAFAAGGIELVKDESLAAGSYKLDAADTIRAYAPDEEGALYALASLLQLTEYKDGQIGICKLHIEDYADKGYRSLMVDLGRQWHPFDKLLKFVDICFYYKIKHLHLHFIDNLLYTLPSKVLPKLSTPGKHYSFEQIAELNAYAKERGIVLVPEYECPGHARQFILKYPEIFADRFEGEVSSDVYTESGVQVAVTDLMCATGEAGMDANKALLKEIAEMFPDSPYIHIGGDEANIGLWNKCSDCKKYMEENGIEDEYELYSEFVGKIASYVLSLGRTPIVWEGFPKKGHERIPKETIVIAWESHYQMAYELLEEGFRIINASWEPLYIVPSFRQRWNAFDIMKWDVHHWQHWWPKSDARLNPFSVPPTDRVLGAILCSWEETFEQEINQVMENLAAVAERTWSVRRTVTDEEYHDMFQSQRMRIAKIIQDR